MKQSEKPVNLWSLPLLIAWGLFFVVGLCPRAAFELLRNVAWVAPQQALVNSSSAISIALAYYLGAFAYGRCREAGLTPGEAWARGVVVGILGLAAFLDFPIASLMARPEHLGKIGLFLLYAKGFGKLLSWACLYVAVLRYYALGDDLVFVRMLPPSEGDMEGEKEPLPASNVVSAGEASSGESRERSGR